jgi:hypothetical protein
MFKPDPSGTESVLYRFNDSTDGFEPIAGLISDPAGNLYGTSHDTGVPGNPSASGTVFKLTPVTFRQYDGPGEWRAVRRQP